MFRRIMTEKQQLIEDLKPYTLTDCKLERLLKLYIRRDRVEKEKEDDGKD